MNARGSYGDQRGSWPRIGAGFKTEVPHETLQAFTAKLDAKIYDLAKTWRPTGVFQPDEVDKIVTETLALMTTARTTLLKAPEKSRDAAQQKREWLGQLERKAAEATRFLTAALDARTKTAAGTPTLVTAPDLKKWVLDAMQAASNAIMAALAQGYFAMADVQYFSSVEGQFNLLSFTVKKYAGHVKDMVETAKGALGYVKPALYVALGLAGIFTLSKLRSRN